MLYVVDLLVENISVITHQHLAILVMRIVNCTEELVHEVDARQQDLWFLTSISTVSSPEWGKTMMGTRCLDSMLWSFGLW